MDHCANEALKIYCPKYLLATAVSCENQKQDLKQASDISVKADVKITQLYCWVLLFLKYVGVVPNYIWESLHLYL